MPKLDQSSYRCFRADVGLISGFVFRAVNKGGRMTGQILGHANIKTTQRYVNQTNSVLDEAREILEKRKA